MAHFRTFLALGVSLSALAVPAYAQDAPAPAPADEAQPADTTAQEQDDEEAIVITADRREQSLQDGSIKLQITDNGKGIDPERRPDSQQWGLVGMAERVSTFNGQFRIDRAKPRGT